MKIVVVTGASRGIGFATAKLFLKNNFKAVLISRTQESVQKAKQRLIDEDEIAADSIITKNADLSVESQIEDLCKVLIPITSLDKMIDFNRIQWDRIYRN